MAPFAGMFTAPTWQRVLVLLIGAVLSPGCRTVAAALRVTGLDQDPHFTNYHRVLNRSRWSSRRVARCLFRLLVDTFVPSGPVIVGLDDTLERRWGAKIAARGIYRDPTRSSHGHFVKASGLRWLSVMVLPEIAWAGRVWAPPFLTALRPREYRLQPQTPRLSPAYCRGLTPRRRGNPCAFDPLAVGESETRHGPPTKRPPQRP